MSDVPRMFPALDGSGPGDQPTTDDITGVPLKPLDDSAEPWPESTAGGSSMPSMPRDDFTQTDADAPEAPDEGKEQETKKNRRSARERIAQITKRYRQEQSRSEDLMEEIRKRDERINRLEQRISSRPQARSSTASESSYASALGGGDIEAPPADVADIVSREVRRAIEPIVRHQEEAAQRQAIEREQQGSYLEALKELPELQDPNSAEASAFREIWQATPLRNDPDGPYNVALMVKGAFAEERQMRPTREARKRAASIITPGPSPHTREPAPRSRNMQQLAATGLQRIREGDGSAETYVAVRKAMRRARQR